METAVFDVLFYDLFQCLWNSEAYLNEVFPCVLREFSPKYIYSRINYRYFVHKMKSRTINSDYMKDVILWFIGAGTEVQDIKNQRLITLKRAKPYEANFNEIFDFLGNLQYVKPYSKPSKRAVYKWLHELEMEGLIKVKGKAKRNGRGKPFEIYELTEKGKAKRLLINKKFMAEELLSGENDILFTMSPNREYLTLHVVTKDKELIELVWREIEKLVEESGVSMQGRKGDIFFKGHPIFENIGNAIFLYVYALLKLRGKYSPSEKQFSDMAKNVLQLFPFLQPFINSDFEREGVKA
jgi:DNA-binding PadR family transcriptional regulator